jgi:hypothetical protein
VVSIADGSPRDTSVAIGPELAKCRPGDSLLTVISSGVKGIDKRGEFLLILSDYFDVELRLSPRWVGDNIGTTDATKTCHILKAYIFETNNRKVINDASLDSL